MVEPRRELGEPDPMGSGLQIDKKGVGDYRQIFSLPIIFSMVSIKIFKVGKVELKVSTIGASFLLEV